MTENFCLSTEMQLSAKGCSRFSVKCERAFPYTLPILLGRQIKNGLIPLDKNYGVSNATNKISFIATH